MVQAKNKQISSGLEDYIEAIYLTNKSNDTLKGVELARILNVSRASVSEALSKLVAKDLVIYNSYGNITLTNKGLTEAKKVYEKHSIIKNFLETVLEINSTEAGENACKIEHIISQNVIDKMSEFTKQYKLNH